VRVVVAAGANIESRVVLAVGIHAQAQQLLLVRGGGLADLVDHAARRDLAVHHGGRTLQDFHPLQVPAVEHAAVPLAALRRAHAIQGYVVGPAAGIEAADAEVVHAVVDAAAFQAHARHIAHRIVERLHAARIQFGAFDHRHRLRRFGNAGIGPGCAAGAVGCAVGVDLDCIQGGGRLCEGGRCGGAGDAAGDGQQVGMQPAEGSGGGGHVLPVSGSSQSDVYSPF
jgi:hypothetical protein